MWLQLAGLAGALGWLGFSPCLSGPPLSMGFSPWPLQQRSWTPYLESQGSYSNTLTMRPKKEEYLPLSCGAS